MVSHTLINKSSSVVVPCKLSRLASSSTISKVSVMPQMTVNNWTVSLVSLLSSSAERNLSNSLALFPSWLNKPLLISSNRRVTIAQDKFRVLRTVSFSGQISCTMRCKHFRTKSPQEKGLFSLDKSGQHDDLATMQKNYHWIVFWRHSVVTQVLFLKPPLFLLSKHRHSFCNFLCASNCNA
jgi:hypothetical protein